MADDKSQERSESAAHIERAISRLEDHYNFPGLMDHLANFAGSIFGMSSLEFPDFKRFWAEVREINEMFSERDLYGGDRKRLREQLSALCETAKESNRELRSWHESKCDEHRNEIERAINRLRHEHGLDGISTFLNTPNLQGFWGDQTEVRTMFKELKPLRREDRESLWDELNALCDKARFYQEERNAERDKKRQEWRERMHEKIDEWRSKIDKKNDLVSRVESQIEELEVKRDSAWSAEFADKVQGWIDEKRQFISELEEQIEDLQSRIRDVDARLAQ